MVGAFVGLVFVAAAGIGLADITTSSPVSQAVSTTLSTGIQTTNGRETESADDQGNKTEQETEAAETDNESVSSVQTAPLLQTTTGEDTSSTTGKGQEKVVLCHHTGSVKHPSHTITVAAPAVPAHMAHGDDMDACQATTPTVETTSVAPAGTTTTTSTHHLPKVKNHVTGHGKGHAAGGTHGHGNGQAGHGKGK